MGRLLAFDYTNATLYRRCHEMGDAIMAALAPEKGKTP